MGGDCVLGHDLHQGGLGLVLGALLAVRVCCLDLRIDYDVGIVFWLLHGDDLRELVLPHGGLSVHLFICPSNCLFIQNL